MRVVITGAAGSIGSQIVDELSGSHELCLIDSKPVPGRTSVVTDLAKYHASARPRSWPWSRPRLSRNAFESAEVVVHLAEDPSSEASWERVLHNNIQATWNVLQASVQHGVRRVVYASSNWAVRALERELAPACYMPDGPKIGSEVQPRPINPYGIGKACGEIAGRMLVDDKKLDSFVAVRIGWYYPPPPPTSEEYRRLEISAQDIRSLFRSCVEVAFGGFHVVYGVSAQRISPYNLSHTRRLLGWEPQPLS